MKKQAKHRKTNRVTKATFRELMDASKEQAATYLWEKARVVSSLRHLCKSSGRRYQARKLGQQKKSLVLKAIQLAPDLIKVTIDNDYHIGLLSIRWQGHGWLHLPANTQLPEMGRSMAG